MPAAMIAATLLVAFVDRIVIPSLLWFRDGLITLRSRRPGRSPLPHLPPSVLRRGRVSIRRWTLSSDSLPGSRCRRTRCLVRFVEPPRHGDPPADALRERRILVRCLSARIDQARRPHLGERVAGVDHAALVEQLVNVAVQQDAVVPRSRRADLLRVHADVGRAVVGAGVVELRLLRELVHRLDVVEQHPSYAIAGSPQRVQVDVLAAVIGSKPDQVALVGHHVVELVLPEEAGERVVGLADLLARLDRDGQVLAVLESPAHDGVGDLRGAPVRQEEVEAVEAREIVGARLPAFREVRLGAVVEVPEIVDREPVPAELAVRRPRDVGEPGSVVARPDRAPPDEKHGDRRGERRETPAERSHEEQDGEADDRPRDGEEVGQASASRAGEVERERPPGEKADGGELEQTPHDPTHHAARLTSGIRPRTVWRGPLLDDVESRRHGVSRCSSRIRRTSAIVCGFVWQECVWCTTTTSDSTPSMWALSYSTTPSFCPCGGKPPFTGMIECAVTPDTIGSCTSVRTKRFPGVMLSTAVGAPRTPSTTRASLFSVTASVTTRVTSRGACTSFAPRCANQLPAT